MKNQCRFSISRVFPAIAHNVYGLAKWGNLTHKSRLELLMFNKNTKDE